MHRRQRQDRPGTGEPLEVRREGLGEGPVANQDSRPGLLVQRLRGEIGDGDENLFGVLDDRLGMWDLPGVPQHGGSREGWLGGTR